MTLLSADQAHFVHDLATRTRMAPEVAASWVGAVTGWNTTRADHNYVDVPGETFPSAAHGARRVAALVNRHHPEVRNAGAAGPTAQAAAIGALAWTPATVEGVHRALATVRTRRPQLEATPRRPEATLRRRREPSKRGTQSIEDLARLAVGAGIPTGDPLIIAVAVALAESGGNPLAHNRSTDSRGLWQINARAHPDWARRGDLYDPTFNAQAMAAVSAGGTNWQPWEAYTGSDGKGSDGPWRRFESQVRDRLTVNGSGTIPGINLGTVDPTDPADVAGALGTVAGFFGFDKLALQWFQIVITGLFTLTGLALVAMGLFRITGTDPKAALSKASAVAGSAALAAGTGGAAAPALAAAAL